MFTALHMIAKNFINVRESHNILEQSNYDTTNLNGTNKDSLSLPISNF